jgi:CxxC motif-containing protein (DUF1111 family)
VVGHERSGTGHLQHVVLIVGACAMVACTSSDPSSTTGPGPGSSSPSTEPATTDVIDTPDDAAAARSGGDATVFVDGRNAFGQPIDALTREERRAFAVGNNFFNDNWVTAPASTEGRDGLGPLFNAQSCSSCHEFDGRGAPPMSADDPERGLLLRLSVVGPDGHPVPDPVYGGQLQDRAINGVPVEGRIVIERTEVDGAYADGTPYTLLAPTYSIEDLGYGPLATGVMVSPRIAPAVFGVGLLEAVPDDALLALADPDDANGDGISGRVNRVLDPSGALVIGRLGWKANVATVEQQTAGAFHGDIGITSSLQPDQDCTDAQPECRAAIDGGQPELTDAKLERVTFYTRTLAVPARRDVGDPDTEAGAQLFGELGCASCHRAEMQTGEAQVAATSNQTIRPYTDLLLHDMGPGLADGRPDGEATGSEWRTAPLWGIGLIDDVNDHTRLLHDGRARNAEEAILWHGGEAAAAQGRFLQLDAAARDRLLAFLDSL